MRCTHQILSLLLILLIVLFLLFDAYAQYPHSIFWLVSAFVRVSTSPPPPPHTIRPSDDHHHYDRFISIITRTNHNLDRMPQQRHHHLRIWSMTPISSSSSSSLLPIQNNVTSTSTTTTATSKPPLSPQQQPTSPQQSQNNRPLPAMPSLLFQQLAYSQMELLASSLVMENRDGPHRRTTSSTASTSASTHPSSKTKSIVLYLPQEHSQTGQLEFLPMIIYPYQNERIFIANAYQHHPHPHHHGMSRTASPPIIPNVITKLPGFAPAITLLPQYPMIYTSQSYTSSSRTTSPFVAEPGIGRVEEVYCDWRSGTMITSLSVPLLIGSQTVGVLLVSPTQSALQQSTTTAYHSPVVPFWTDYDRQQVARAATSLSLALSMDTERQSSSQQQQNRIELEQQQLQKQQFYNSLSDHLHQLKNPIQALRTYGKLLQRRLVEISKSANDTMTSLVTEPNDDTEQLLELADHLMQQSDRIVERLKPVDTIVEHIQHNQQPNPVVAFLPSAPTQQSQQRSIVPYIPRLLQQQPDDSAKRPSWQVDTNAYSSSGSDTAIVVAKTDIFNRTSGRNIAAALSDERYPLPTNRNNNSNNSTGAFPSLSFNSIQIDIDIGTNLNPSIEERKEMAFVMDVLESVFRDFHIIATEQNIDFRVIIDDIDSIPGVSIYPNALQEVLINLLDNAFKYVQVAAVANDGNIDDNTATTTKAKATSNGFVNPTPQVRVRIYPNELRNDSSNSTDPNPYRRPGVTIIVEDNGAGISRNDSERIFDRGYRNVDLSSKVPGSGIGLSIAKSYIKSMGGILRTIPNIVDTDTEEELSSLRTRRRRSFTISTKTTSSLPYLSGAVMEVILFR